MKYTWFERALRYFSTKFGTMSVSTLIKSTVILKSVIYVLINACVCVSVTRRGMHTPWTIVCFIENWPWPFVDRLFIL